MKKTLFVSAVVLAALCFTSCGKKDEAAKGKGDAEAVFAVNSYKVVQTNLDDYLEFGGDVQAVSSVAVLPDMAGKISSINVKLGEKVSKNQVIANVDASRPGMVFTASPVRAPVAGTVVSLPGVVGNQVSQASIIAKISSTNQLEISASVPERYISRISMNEKAILSFDAYPGETFAARIKEISPILDTTTRTMNIKLSIDQNNPKIKIGMYARIHLVTEHKVDVTVVPYGTVIKKNGNPYIYKISRTGDEAVVSMIPVKVGLRVDDLQEILEGINAGDEVVVKGQTLLNDGSKVNVVSTK